MDQTAASLVRGIFVVNNSSASFPCSGKRQFRSEPASSLSAQGLFSIDGLQQPADFLNLATAAIRECDSLRETLRSRNSSGSSPSGVTGVRHATETLFLLDSISRCVCNVIDAAELCRNVHSSERWRDSAGEAFRVLAEYISQLNADRSLYEALDGVYKSPVFADLTEEQRRFAAILRAEFERDGIHLPDDERERLVQLHSHVSGIETLFQQNIQTARNTFEAEYELVTSIIPDEIVFGATGGPDAVPSDPDGMITLETHTHVANTLGRFSSVPDIRRDVYMASNTTCPENLEVLQALRHYRHTIATAQGFESYAERFLTDKMAQNQANVDRFLLDLQERIKKPFRADMEMIADAKRKVERSSDVEPWDIAFYTTLLKARNGFDPSAVAAYLTLDGCLDSMVHLVRHLFGIDMKESPMSVHEQWDVSFAESSSSSSSPSSSSSLRKYSFYDEDGTEVGTMYFDLHARDGKYGHAAHFTVRCGCALDPDSTQFQLPVVAIVCNMSSNIDGKSTCLSHGEVETLFHEFGHALHSLLSRTAFQHMSGTRAAMDFVETPCEFFVVFVGCILVASCLCFDWYLCSFHRQLFIVRHLSLVSCYRCCSYCSDHLPRLATNSIGLCLWFGCTQRT